MTGCLTRVRWLIERVLKPWSGRPPPAATDAEPVPRADPASDPHPAPGAHSAHHVHVDAAVHASETGVAQWDKAERLVTANTRIAAIFGVSADCVVAGLNFREFIRIAVETGYLDGQETDDVYEMAMSLIRRCTPVTYDTQFSDGRVLRVAYRPLDHGGWLATYQDVTEHRQAQAQVAFMQRHDALTRLPNRALFHDRLVEALARVRNVAVLFVDLDRFKQINDTLGSAAGDTLLQFVAGRLTNCVRSSDTVARLGSDEFAVMLVPGSHEVAAVAAKHVIEMFTARFEIGGREVGISASIGAAVAPADGEDADSLLRNANLALHAAKADGRSVCSFFEQTMEDRMRARWEIESDLRTAIAERALELFYQPLVSTRTGKVSALEALMRWRHPQRGMIPPSAFIPVAEATRLIIPLGAWSIQRACADLTTLPPHLRMAVNLSTVQFGSDDLVQTVRDALTASSVAPDRLELEVTETTLIQDANKAVTILSALRDLGVRIAMDDFGTGYSSLSYIRKFPFDKIKIDKSFIDELGERRGSDAIVQAVAWIASSMGIETVAEGVETPEQYQRVVAAGCDHVQGFLFGRPMPLARLSDAIAAIDARQRSPSPQNIQGTLSGGAPARPRQGLASLRGAEWQDNAKCEEDSPPPANPDPFCAPNPHVNGEESSLCAAYPELAEPKPTSQSLSLGHPGKFGRQSTNDVRCANPAPSGPGVAVESLAIH
jgi:diguanylate cyclase (GGDEF)-like protein